MGDKILYKILLAQVILLVGFICVVTSTPHRRVGQLYVPDSAEQEAAGFIVGPQNISGLISTNTPPPPPPQQPPIYAQSPTYNQGFTNQQQPSSSVPKLHQDNLPQPPPQQPISSYGPQGQQQFPPIAYVPPRTPQQPGFVGHFAVGPNAFGYDPYWCYGWDCDYKAHLWCPFSNKISNYQIQLIWRTITRHDPYLLYSTIQINEPFVYIPQVQCLVHFAKSYGYGSYYGPYPLAPQAPPQTNRPTQEQNPTQQTSFIAPIYKETTSISQSEIGPQMSTQRPFYAQRQPQSQNNFYQPQFPNIEEYFDSQGPFVQHRDGFSTQIL